MIGGFHSPFRQTCGGALGGPKYFWGYPFQHGGSATVDAYGNTTQMKDHCGNVVTPFPRKYQQDACGNYLCTGDDCNACPDGFDLIINTPEPPAIADNTWEKNGTANLAQTRKLAFKPVQAHKGWQGQFGFLHDSSTGKDCATNTIRSNDRYLTVTVDASFELLWDDTDGTTMYHITSAISGARTVNKLTGEITSTLSSSETDENYPDPLGGFGGHVTTFHSENGAGYRLEDNGTPEGIVVDYDRGLSTNMDYIPAANVSCSNNLAMPANPYFGGDSTFDDLIANWNAINSGDPSKQFPAVTDPNSYDETVAYDVPEGDGSTLHVSYKISWSRSDTSYTWDVEYSSSFSDTLSGNPETRTVSFSGSITLSNAYSMADNYADTVDLADQWSLTDDVKYPYRTDSHTTIAPLVIRNEYGTAAPAGFNAYQVDDYTKPVDNDDGDAPFSSGWVSNPKWDLRAWFDPNVWVWQFPTGDDQTTAAATGLAARYDGSIIGAPLQAGYGQPVGGHPRGVFDKDHENWFRRNCDSGWTQEPESRGNFTPDFLPSNAPKWTDDFIATTLYPCPFVNADVTGCYLQKWAEVQIKRPSINFGRPYGPDKYALDETTVYYVQDFTAGVVTLKNTDFSTPSSLPFIVGDLVGSAKVGGVFPVTAVGSNTVTLGTKVSDLPAGWNTPSGDGADCFGKFRYPTCPGMDFIDERTEIGGRVEITNITNASPAVLTTITSQKYLSITTPENIDICDANMTVLASNVPATRVSDTQFSVTTAYATIQTAKYIIPHGYKYKFADSQSKGDYVFRTWLINLDTTAVIASTQVDSCLAFSPCGPSVAIVTPNGETNTNGNRHSFPSSINNGELWLGQIQFWMVDPFWQEPHTPVAATDELTETDYEGGTDQMIWRMDDGSCAVDYMEIGGGGENVFHKFYPIHPFVEARCTLPAVDGETAPAPAGGTDITAVTTPPPQATIGNVDGTLVNAIVLPAPVWETYAKEKACVDAAGRFAEDYEANGT